MLSLNAVELQVLGIPLVAGLLVAWGALHILAMADRAATGRPLPDACAWRWLIARGAGGKRRHVVERRAPG
jgi:predicted anti-sigma-YlaC factor YlaD